MKKEPWYKQFLTPPILIGIISFIISGSVSVGIFFSEINFAKRKHDEDIQFLTAKINSAIAVKDAEIKELKDARQRQYEQIGIVRESGMKLREDISYIKGYLKLNE